MAAEPIHGLLPVIIIKQEEKEERGEEEREVVVAGEEEEVATPPAFPFITSSPLSSSFGSFTLWSLYRHPQCRHSPLAQP